MFQIALFALQGLAPTSPPPPAVRHPLLYNVDTSDLADRLVEKLEAAPDRNVLRWAILRLGEMGDEAIPALRRSFYRNFQRQELYPAVSNLCEALGQTRSKKAFLMLADALSHPSGIVRTRAVDSLIAIEDPEIFPFLQNLFPVENKEYKVRLLNGMARTGSPEFVPFVEELFETFPTDPLKELALQHVSDRYAKEGAKFLRRIFENPQGKIRFRLVAAMGLAEVGDEEAVEHLRQSLGEENHIDDRVKAVIGLGAAGRIDLVASYVDGQVGGLRLALLRALQARLERGAGGGDDRSRTLDLLRKLTQDPEPSIRVEAVQTLFAAGERQVLDPYLSVLRNEPDPERMKEAVEILTRPSVRDSRAVPIAVERFAKSGSEMRRNLMQVLGALHDPRGVAPLVGLLVSAPDPADFARDEMTALHLAFLGEPAVQPLIDLAKTTEDGRVRRWAIRALAWSKQPKARDFLLERMGDPKEDRDTRFFLVRELPQFGGLEAAGMAKRILHREPDPQLRLLLNDVLWDYY